MKNKIQLTINLLNRNNDELIQSNINLDELIKIYESQKSDFHEKYSVYVEIKFNGYDYKIQDYNLEYFNEPLNKIRNISTYGVELIDIQHMYNISTRRNEIPELYDIQNNNFNNESFEKYSEEIFNLWLKEIIYL